MKDGFKASNDWLNWLKKRHGISRAVICGKSDSVHEEVVESRKSRLPDITAKYTTCDICNMDESRFFFGHCQIKLSEKKELNVKEEKGRKNGLRPCSA